MDDRAWIPPFAARWRLQFRIIAYVFIARWKKLLPASKILSMHRAMHNRGLPQPLLIGNIATQFPSTKWGRECLRLIGDRRTATTALKMQRSPDLPGNACVAIRT